MNNELKQTRFSYLVQTLFDNIHVRHFYSFELSCHVVVFGILILHVSTSAFVTWTVINLLTCSFTYLRFYHVRTSDLCLRKGLLQVKASYRCNKILLTKGNFLLPQLTLVSHKRWSLISEIFVIFITNQTIDNNNNDNK